MYTVHTARTNVKSFPCAVFQPTGFHTAKTADFGADLKRVKGRSSSGLLTHQGRGLVEAAVFVDGVTPFFVFGLGQQVLVGFRDQAAGFPKGVDELGR